MTTENTEARGRGRTAEPDLRTDAEKVAAEDAEKAAKAQEKANEEGEKQAQAARDARREALAIDEEEVPQSENKERGDAKEQTEAARKAQEEALQAELDAALAGAGQADAEAAKPEGFSPKKAGDSVFYGFDHDGIIEYREAKVIDVDPYTDQRLQRAFGPTALNLLVNVDAPRFNANFPEVLRLNTEYGEGPGQWLPSKPSGADDRFKSQIVRRAQRDAIRREEALQSPAQRATPATA